MRDLIPDWLTPGAAETLAVKIYRTIKIRGQDAAGTLRDVLTGYQNPVPLEIMRFQIALAIDESSDRDFIPAAFRATVQGIGK